MDQTFLGAFSDNADCRGQDAFGGGEIFPTHRGPQGFDRSTHRGTLTAIGGAPFGILPHALDGRLDIRHVFFANFLVE